MQIGGPKCGCGNHGCLEALASRTAIENQLRGDRRRPPEVLTELLGGDLQVIRSSARGKPWTREDPLVTEILRHTSEILGYACLTVRHLIDPEVIVLGGGVIEACSDFVLPIVKHRRFGPTPRRVRPGGRVLASALGDDAVSLGAVALVRIRRAEPLQEALRRLAELSADQPALCRRGRGGRQDLWHDVYITVDGLVEKRKKKHARDSASQCHRSQGAGESLSRWSGGHVPGNGNAGEVRLNDEAYRYLAERSIDCKAMPTPEVIEANNRSKYLKRP